MDGIDGIARPDCAAQALFLDDDGAVLLVEPVHRSRWTVPGGAVERGETPREACARALADDLGLTTPLGPLLVVDWAPHVREERVRFVFDGGVLAEQRFDALVLAPGLASWALLPPDELFVMTAPRVCRRVTAALDARRAGTPVYLEHGEPAPGHHPR